MEALSAAFSADRVGEPFDEATDMGPLAAERQRDRVEAYIATGVDQGARLATGGGRPKHLDRGWFVEPTVFAGVDNSWRIAQEEIFGPVLSVVPARDDADAVQIANDTIYGLNASVFTPDVDRARAIAAELRSEPWGTTRSGATWGSRSVVSNSRASAVRVDGRGCCLSRGEDRDPGRTARPLPRVVEYLTEPRGSCGTVGTRVLPAPVDNNILCVT